MPERWQRELEKLNTVTEPASVGTRIAHGPAGEGVPATPGRRQRLVAGVVAFAVFAGAIALAWGAFGRGGSVPLVGSTDTPQVTIVLRGGEGPSARLRYKDTTLEPQTGSYCWSSESSGICADTVLRPFSDGAFVSIPLGTTISLDADADHVELQSMAGDDPSGRVALRALDGAFEEPGRFVLLVSASWPEGEVDFFFPVDVVQDGQTPRPVLVATLAAPRDGSTPVLSLSYEGRSRDFFAQGGSWPGFDGYDDLGQVFPTPIPSGTILQVDGDAVDVMAEIGLGTPVGEGPYDLAFRDRSAALPDRAGTYLLTIKGVWPEGVVAFPVAITVAASTAPPPASPSVIRDPSESPSLESPAPSFDVPDLVGMTDQQAMKALDDLGLQWIVAFRAVDGEVWRVVQMDPPAGSSITGGSEVRLLVATDITPLPAGAEDALSCPVPERVAFGGPHLVLTPGGEAFIRGNTVGVRLGDDIVQVTFTDQEWHGLWHVMRDGAVIAVVDWQTLDGVACAGSGVGAA